MFIIKKTIVKGTPNPCTEVKQCALESHVAAFPCGGLQAAHISRVALPNTLEHNQECASIPYTGGIEVIIGISKARLRCLGITRGVFLPFLVLDTEIAWRITMLRILVPTASTNTFPAILYKVHRKNRCAEIAHISVPNECLQF